jgi:addiction module HigA family antidote
VTEISCGLRPLHPGELLREEILPALAAPPAGLPPELLADLVAERVAVTPETAELLAPALGTSPEVWINLQRKFDAAKAADSTRQP